MKGNSILFAFFKNRSSFIVMHILHISSDFSNTKVHAYLYRELDKKGVRQTIFNPIRIKKRDTIGRNEFKSEHTRFVYADVVKPYHRLLFHVKKKTVFHALVATVDLSDVDIVHASTLFTDGVQAYEIYKKYGIPYVIAIRNTDINVFLKKLPNTWPMGKQILLNAKMIFFPSIALMNTFCNNKVIRPFLTDIKDKMLFVPNGIDDSYIDSVSHNRCKGHKVLYVGNFSKNKNVTRLCEAVLRLKEVVGFQDVTLSLVGGGGDSNGSVSKFLSSYPDTFSYLGPIYNKEELRDLYRSHSVFAMVSHTETFGLVYLEALSQNLPVIFSKGQGIDGLFDGSVGIGVYPCSVENISDAIQRIMSNQSAYSNKNIDFEHFRWKSIAETYYNLYGKQMIKDTSK